MKKIKEIKPGAKKQLFSGMIYMALAVTVVAVTIGTIVSTFNPDENPIKNGDSVVDEIAKDPTGNNISIDNFSLETPVSDSPFGIDATVIEPSNHTSQPPSTEEKQPDKDSDSPNTSDLNTKEQVQSSNNAEKTTGAEDFNGFIRPCTGYIGKEFSMDIPIYSPSMYDYRTHNGIDIVCEVGTPVKASSGGTISDIYDHYLYGTTVVIDHRNGMQSVYSNLSPDLPAQTVIGGKVMTGEIIAGVGESAALEAAEAMHLHFELIKDGKQVNPPDYFAN